ncbi:MAG TPA: S53 family peptidase [Terracidiphilus sp.]|jgi:subtilase family serine protease
MRLMKAFPLNVLAILAGVLLCSIALLAQNSSVAPRITTDVNELSLATLRGNVPRLARAEFDQGETSASTQLTHMRLVLSRSSEQQAALDAYLAQLQDKSSPNYHKWLTPEQFGQLYGPADSDIAALVAWLESHGLQVETVSKGRTNIAFNGTVSQAEEAFHISIHSFQAGERQFYSNTTDPQIPSALANVVKGVAHLNTIRPRPHSVHGSPGRINPETGRLEPANAAEAVGPRVNLTTGSGTTVSPYILWMVPADAATIYDTPNTFNANFSGTACGSSSGCTGAGVKIGVGGVATIGTGSIVQTYRSTFLGSTYATPPTIIPTGSGLLTDSGDVDEAYIDTELSGGLAPGASIYYYPSEDLISGIQTAIDDNVVDIFSLSFGECEADMGSDNALLNGYWEQAAGQGIAVTVSTGDTGSASCDGDRNGTISTAIDGLSVSGYASTPYNIAVGGTDFYGLEHSFSTYISTSTGTAGAPTYYRTVLGSGPHNGYIPESIWNDSTSVDTTPLSGNVTWSGAGYSSSDNNIVAGSGGVSSCATGSGNTCAGYPRPSWQTGSGIPATVPTGVNANARSLPDVSVMSGNGYDSATWLICDSTENCSSISGGNFDGYGGTSTAAPAFAGILALVQQKTGSRLGQAAQELYSLYNGSYASSVFHDVTVGNNSVPCNSGTSNCVDNTAGYYYESGYNTLTGYDLASGIGSVDAMQLVNYWGSSTGSSATYTLAATSPSSIAPGGSATSTVTVSSSNSYAGTVTLACALTSGPTNTSGDAPYCSSGSNTVTLSSGTTSGTATITVYTTAASAALAYPRLPGRDWTGAGGGAVLAFLIFLGIPARRRSWRSMLVILVMMAALSSLAACGHGGGGGGGGGNSGTTAGTYTFTVTGTGVPALTPAPTTTFTVTVN